MLYLFLSLFLLFHYFILSDRLSVFVTDMVHAPPPKGVDIGFFHQIVFIKIEGGISIDFHFLVCHLKPHFFLSCISSQVLYLCI
jgi:hypothetical protein